MIRLWRTSENVSLEIQDSGTGMSVEKLAAIRTHRSGVGITGMRERVRHLQGEKDIQSNAAGTKISIMFPLSMTTASDTGVTAEKAKAAQ